jgi:Xaa-Pro aminopeptidase
MSCVPLLDSQFFAANRASLMARMAPDSIAIVHSNDVMPRSGDGTLGFSQNSSLFYLTGIAQEETILILNPSAPSAEERERLFLRETSDLIRIWEGDRLTREQATVVSGIANAQWLDQFRPALRRLARKAGRIYLEANEHPRATREVPSRSQRFREECQTLYPRHEYARLAPLLYQLREIKHTGELDLIRTACEITGAGFQRVLHFVRPGVHEFEVEAEYLHEFIRRGSRGFAYLPIVASGANACVLHYIENRAECRGGDLLLLDVAAEYGSYNADLTRTIPVNGRFSPRQRQVYEAVLRIFKACRDDLLRPGVHLKEYQKSVGRVVEGELVGLGLLEARAVAEERARDGTKEECQEEKRLYRKYFMHGTSHSLGLDVHDVQDADRIVKTGMVLTIEPGLYLREEGLGIRLESDFFVGPSGNVDLMKDIPIEPDEIEAAMTERVP